MTRVKKFEIRIKKFDFNKAPVLDGVTAWYKALIIDFSDQPKKSGVKHIYALNAAIEAAGMDYSIDGEGDSYVSCEYIGTVRPKGVMSKPMHVSYRPRF